jgi:Pvc16 N-terminal domain/CarboxypepD_reg-like domain
VIRDLDTSLKAMLAGEAAPGSELAGATISFAVPDSRWRNAGSGLFLDVYLYKVEEDRELRSNERRHHVDRGVVMVEPPPVRVACSYLVTAWNMAQPASGSELEEQEHRLLSQALDVLLRNPTVPRRYLAGLAGRSLEPPMVSAAPDGVGASADFWSGLGTYLRPSVTCRVTLAFPAPTDAAGAQVATVRAEVDGEELVTIGGTVRDRRAPAGIAGVWVRLVETGATTVTDGAGRFLLSPPATGTWTLAVRAVGYREGGGPVALPHPNATFEVVLDPL